MYNILRIIVLTYVCTLPFVGGAQTTESTQKSTQLPSSYEQIQWIDLLPPEDLHALTEAPIPDSILEGSAEDVLQSQLSISISDTERELSEYEKALISSKFLPEFNNRKIKIPGFIVPIDLNDKGQATSFFLVPFFGACLHLPPPPPNQIIYATYPAGIKVDDLDLPYWMEATIYTKQKQNNIALAAYSAEAHTLYEFKDTDDY